MLLNKSRGCKGKFPLRLQVCELVLAEKLAPGKLNFIITLPYLKCT